MKSARAQPRRSSGTGATESSFRTGEDPNPHPNPNPDPHPDPNPDPNPDPDLTPLRASWNRGSSLSLGVQGAVVPIQRQEGEEAADGAAEHTESEQGGHEDKAATQT